MMQGIVFPFAANSEEEMEAWLRAIGKGIVNATTTGCRCRDTKFAVCQCLLNACQALIF